LGTPDDAQASVPEQPLKADEFLSYADKYQRGGGKKAGKGSKTASSGEAAENSGMASANRRIPAPLSPQLTQQVQQQALKVFKLLDCSGVIRIDFFVNQASGDIFVIEPNTIPGSMSFYLWEATDLPYSHMIDRLVAIAQQQHTAKHTLTTSFPSNILK